MWRVRDPFSWLLFDCINFILYRGVGSPCPVSSEYTHDEKVCCGISFLPFWSFSLSGSYLCSSKVPQGPPRCSVNSEFRMTKWWTVFRGSWAVVLHLWIYHHLLAPEEVEEGARVMEALEGVVGVGFSGEGNSTCQQHLLTIPLPARLAPLPQTQGEVMNRGRGDAFDTFGV